MKDIGEADKFNRKDCSPLSTPMDPIEKLKPNTVGRLSRYPSVLEGYSDASWINHVEDSSFTSGWMFLLGGGAISWAFKKQTCISGSTMELEFVALAAAGKEAEWLRNLVHEILIWPKPITLISIHCDSAATLAKAYSQMYNVKSRHLGVRHSMIRELIMNGVISIEFVRSQHNLADHLTKGLARDLVNKSVIDMESSPVEGSLSQVGSGSHSEKIRTYNYKDNKVTDHRLKMNFELASFLDGDIETAIQSCVSMEQRELLEELADSVGTASR
ncbi:hypothetical protein Tco_0655137 [Tanacetum coccineum]|uniref:Zinc finger, CCHC-type n=1 Tax=Tanacetum coccineum TaxID=301880 RepID=A0ABQ4X5Q1_9ASTR